MDAARKSSIAILIEQLENALRHAQLIRDEQTTTRSREAPGTTLESRSFGPVAALDDIRVGQRVFIHLTNRGTYVSLHPELEARPLQAPSIWDDQPGYRPARMDSFLGIVGQTYNAYNPGSDDPHGLRPHPDGT
jgi:hypothetical protein